MQESAGVKLLEVLLTREEHPRREMTASVVIGKVVELTEKGEPLVDFSSNPSRFPLLAKSTVGLAPETLGAEVVLLFEAADVHKPIIVGVVKSPDAIIEKTQVSIPGQQGSVISVERDGEKVVVSADREIVLRCGEASITLTRAGKILLKGTHVVSRSSGLNQIKGGSVQIN